MWCSQPTTKKSLPAAATIPEIVRDHDAFLKIHIRYRCRVWLPSNQPISRTTLLEQKDLSAPPSSPPPAASLKMPPLVLPPLPLVNASGHQQSSMIANIIDVTQESSDKSKKPPRQDTSRIHLHHPPSTIPSKNIFKRMDSLPSPIPAPKPLLILRRQMSMSPSYRRKSLCASAYAGPAPVRKDGSPLKSCFRWSTSQECSVTSLESDDATPPHRRHRVAFTNVTVREYSLECGDNPSVTSGPPLTLGWKYNVCGRTDIDTFEADKACLGRQWGECRRLSPEEREQMLLTIGGHSHRSIMSAQYETCLAKQERCETINALGGLGRARYIQPRERVLIMKESATRKLERARKGTSTAKEQRKLWEDAQASGQKVP